jgi:hypothetical protein
VDQTDAAERTDEHVGHGGEPEAQLIGLVVTCVLKVTVVSC